MDCLVLSVCMNKERMDGRTMVLVLELLFCRRFERFRSGMGYSGGRWVSFPASCRSSTLNSTTTTTATLNRHMHRHSIGASIVTTRAQAEQNRIQLTPPTMATDAGISRSRPRTRRQHLFVKESQCSSPPPPPRKRKKRSRYAKVPAVRSLMYAFGDDPEPLQESVNVLDEIVTEYAPHTSRPSTVKANS